MKLDTTTFETLITNMFTKKGQKVVEMNIEALHQSNCIVTNHV
jgi:2-oxoglutarate ferredoxin oxidoreductase subunit alpha